MYKIIYSSTFCSGQKLESRGYPFGEWLNKLWYMNVMEYYCAIRDDEQEDFREAWKDLYELMLNERSQNQENFVHSNNHSEKGIFLVDLVVDCNAKT